MPSFDSATLLAIKPSSESTHSTMAHSIEDQAKIKYNKLMAKARSHLPLSAGATIRQTSHSGDQGQSTSKAQNQALNSVNSIPRLFPQHEPRFSQASNDQDFDPDRRHGGGCSAQKGPAAGQKPTTTGGRGDGPQPDMQSVYDSLFKQQVIRWRYQNWIFDSQLHLKSKPHNMIVSLNRIAIAENLDNMKKMLQEFPEINPRPEIYQNPNDINDFEVGSFKTRGYAYGPFAHLPKDGPGWDELSDEEKRKLQAELESQGTPASSLAASACAPSTRHIQPLDPFIPPPSSVGFASESRNSQESGLKLGGATNLKPYSRMKHQHQKKMPEPPNTNNRGLSKLKNMLNLPPSQVLIRNVKYPGKGSSTRRVRPLS